MNRHYVLDTSVLLYSPQTIFAFSEHTAVIPAVVPEEPVGRGLAAHNDCHTALSRFDGKKIVHPKYRARNPHGVSPRSIGQVFMQECLMMRADEAPLVIIKGPAVC